MPFQSLSNIIGLADVIFVVRGTIEYVDIIRHCGRRSEKWNPNADANRNPAHVCESRAAKGARTLDP